MAKEITTALSEWTNSFTQLVKKDFDECGVAYDAYAAKCAMSAMTNIYQLVGSAELQTLDRSNLREVVGQAASLKLNANAMPRECYFQVRKKKVSKDEWKSIIEMGVIGPGNDAILRNFGVNVAMVYPAWVVHEGDIFVYPHYKGVEIVPPEWAQSGSSEKVSKVVYPLKLKDGTMQYLIAEREGVKVNLFAHIRNNLMNETFGICASRYSATEKQKAEIDKKKDEIFTALRNCATLDEMLVCEVARPYISDAWLNSTEEMITTKLRNNAVKKYPKDFDSMANRSFVQIDETYQAQKAEIEQNANTIEVEVPVDVVEVE